MKSRVTGPLVSIVTPVHNEAAYLSECIESVMEQTYQNWDYTIVDNCSTDGSVAIARHYAGLDRRIRIRENREYLRALPNFNNALSYICPTSKYCKVVLGDDWIFPECLEQMVGAAEEHPSVGVVSAYALEGSQVKWTGLPYQITFFSGKDICRQHFLDDLHVFGTPTTVLYRADLVRRRVPFYTETNDHSDAEACVALLRGSDFAFVHQVLTFSRVRKGSRNAISSEVNTYLGGMLQSLVTYGLEYLDSEEFARCVDRYLSEYYRFLGKSVILFRRDKIFWAFHHAQLAEAGFELDRVRLAKAALGTLCEAALNPGISIQKLLNRRKVEPESGSIEL